MLRTTSNEWAARVQAWMLQQANVFTREHLENNRKLADETSDMHQRFQHAMQRLDLMETEKQLIEHDPMARRLSRYTFVQNLADPAFHLGIGARLDAHLGRERWRVT